MLEILEYWILIINNPPQKYLGIFRASILRPPRLFFLQFLKVPWQPEGDRWEVTVPGNRIRWQREHLNGLLIQNSSQISPYLPEHGQKRIQIRPAYSLTLFQGCCCGLICLGLACCLPGKTFLFSSCWLNNLQEWWNLFHSIISSVPCVFSLCQGI